MEDQHLLDSTEVNSEGIINPLRILLDEVAKIDDLRNAYHQDQNSDENELRKEAQRKILLGSQLEDETRQLMVSCLEKKVRFADMEKAESIISSLRENKLLLADEDQMFLQTLSDFMSFFQKASSELKILLNESSQEGLEKTQMVIQGEKLTEELELLQLELLYAELLGVQDLAKKLPNTYESLKEQLEEIKQSFVSAIWLKKAQEIVLHHKSQQSYEHSAFSSNMTIGKFNQFISEAPKNHEKSENILIQLNGFKNKYEEFLESFQAVESFVRSKYSSAVPVTDGISPLMYAADERILAVLVEDTECLVELKRRFGELNEIFKAVPLIISSELRSKQQLIQKVITRIEQFKGNNAAKQGQAQYLMELESSNVQVNSVLGSQSSTVDAPQPVNQPSIPHQEEQIEGSLAFRRANNELSSLRELQQQFKDHPSLPAHKKISITTVISLFDTYKELHAKSQKVAPQLAEMENYLKIYQTEEFTLLKLSKEWIARINEQGLPLKQFRADFDAIIELKKKSIFQWNKYEDNIKGLEVILRLREALEGWNGGTSWKSAGEIQSLLSTLGEKNYVVRSYAGRSLFTSKLEELANIRSELSKLNQEGITIERLEEMSKILQNSFVSCTVEKQRVSKMKAAKENVLSEMNEWDHLKIQGKRVTLERIQGVLEQLKSSGVKMEEKKFQLEEMIEQAQGLQKAVRNAGTEEEYIIKEYENMNIEIMEVEEILKESAEMNNWLCQVECNLSEEESDQSNLNITSDYEQLLELSLQLDGVKERYLQNQKLKNIKEKVFALLAVLVADNWRNNKQLTGFTQNSLNQLHHQAKSFLKDFNQQDYQFSRLFAQMRRSLFGQKENHSQQNGEIIENKQEIEVEKVTESVINPNITKKEEEDLVDIENMIHLDKNNIQDLMEDGQLENKESQDKHDMEEILMEIELEAGDHDIEQYTEKELQVEQQVEEPKDEPDECLIPLIISSILVRRDAMDETILLECAFIVQELWEEMDNRVKEIKATLSIQDIELIEQNGYDQLGCVDLSDVLIEQKSLIEAKQEQLHEENQNNLRNDKIIMLSSQKGKKQVTKLKEKDENKQKQQQQQCKNAQDDKEIKQTPQKKIKEKKKTSEQKQSSSEGKSQKRQGGKKQSTQNKDIKIKGEGQEEQQENQSNKSCLDTQIKKNLDFSEETVTVSSFIVVNNVSNVSSIPNKEVKIDNDINLGVINTNTDSQVLSVQKSATKETKKSSQKQKSQTKQSDNSSTQIQEVSSYSPYNQHSSAQKTSESSPEQQAQKPLQQANHGIQPEQLKFESVDASTMIKNLSEREWLQALDERYRIAGKEIMRQLVSNLHFGETRLCFEIIEKVVQNYLQRIVKTVNKNVSNSNINQVVDQIAQVIMVLKSLHSDPNGSKELRTSAFSYDCLVNIQKKINNQGDSEKQNKIRKQQQNQQNNDNLNKKRRLNDDWLFDGEDVKNSNGNDKDNIEHEDYFKSERNKFSYTQCNDPETRELNKLLSSKDVLMQFRRLNEAAKRNRGMCISVDSEIQDTRMDLTDEEDEEEDFEGNDRKAQKAMFSSDDEDDAIETYYPSVAKYGRDKKTKKLMDPIKEEEMESFVMFCKSQVKAANQRPALFNPLEKGIVEDIIDTTLPAQQPQQVASTMEQIFTVFKGRIHLRVEANYQPIKAICYAETLQSQMKQIPAFQYGQMISQNGESELLETRLFLLKSFCSPAIVSLFGIVETEKEEEQNIINSLAQDLKNRERVSIALWSTAAKVYFFPRRLFDGHEIIANKIAAKLTNSPTELCFAVIFKAGSLSQTEQEHIPKISNPPSMSIQTFAELQALKLFHKREEQSNVSSQALRMVVIDQQGKNDKSNEKRKIKKNVLRRDATHLGSNSESQIIDQKNPLNLLLMPSNSFEVQRTLKQIEDKQELESTFKKASSVKESKNKDAQADVEAFFQRRVEGKVTAKQQIHHQSESKINPKNLKSIEKVEEKIVLEVQTQGINNKEDTQVMEEETIEDQGKVNNLEQSPNVSSTQTEGQDKQVNKDGEDQQREEDVAPQNDNLINSEQPAVEDENTKGMMQVEDDNKIPAQNKVSQTSIDKNRQKILEFSSILDKLNPSQSVKVNQETESDVNECEQIKQEEKDQNEEPQLEEVQKEDNEQDTEKEQEKDQQQSGSQEDESNQELSQQKQTGSSQRFQNSKKWLTPQQQQFQQQFRKSFEKENDPKQSEEIILSDFQSLNRQQQLLQLQLQKQLLQQQRQMKQQQEYLGHESYGFQNKNIHNKNQNYKSNQSGYSHEEQDVQEEGRNPKQFNNLHNNRQQYFSNEQRFSNQYPYQNAPRQPFTNRYNQSQPYTANPNKLNNLSFQSFNSNFVKQSNSSDAQSISLQNKISFQQHFQPQQFNPQLFPQMNNFTGNNNNRMLSLMQPPVPPQPQQPPRQQLQPHQQFMKNHLVRYDSQSNPILFSQQPQIQFQPQRPMLGQAELKQEQPIPMINTKATESSLLDLRDQLDSLLSVIQIKQRVYGMK